MGYWHFIEQESKNVSSTSSRFVTFELRYLLAAFEGRSSTSSRFVTLSFAIFRQHLKVVHLRVRISPPSSLAIFYQHLKVVHLRVRVWSPLSFAIFWQHLKRSFIFEFRHLWASPSSSSIWRSFIYEFAFRHRQASLSSGSIWRSFIY